MYRSMYSFSFDESKLILHVSVRIVTGHNRLTRVCMRVQKIENGRDTDRKQKTENTATQIFYVENPNREKPRGPQTPRKTDHYEESKYNKIL